MANINDFKLVALKSKKMFEFISAKNECDDLEKSRLGFYHLVLENITGIRDVDRIQDIIIDSSYNKLIFNNSVNDLGMDAVNIIGDDEAGEVTIQFFNFKYRNKFNPDKTKEEDSLSRSTKYLEYVLGEDDVLNDLPDDKVRQSLVKVKRLLNSNVMCNLILYMVSNEAQGFSIETNSFIRILESAISSFIANSSLANSRYPLTASTLTGIVAIGLFGMAGFKGVLMLGSIGPRVACFVIIIELAPILIRVPALCALCGIITSNTSQYWHSKLTMFHATAVSPPRVYRYSDILGTVPI